MRPITIPYLLCLCLFAITPAIRAEDKASAEAKKLAPFALQDYRGKEHSLDDFKQHQLLVVAFVGTECPLAKLYGPRLAKLAEQYAEKGVGFVGIDANAQDTVTALAAFARVHGIKFPLLKDAGNKVADQIGAKRTPEVFLLDAERVVRYRGRIDDQYGIGFARDEPRRQDLAAAIDELLAGKPVSTARTEAPGCLIGRVRETKADSAVTYSKHIAPIFNKSCVECHRKGDIAPFALTDYKKAAGWGETILEVIDEGRMPPWHADPKHGKFANERRLSDGEKKQIRAWVEAGAPEGDPKDAPPPPKFTEGWQLPRQPDLVVAMRDKPYNVPAEGTVKYQYFQAETGLKEDRWIEAAEVMPGNRAVVHHILVFAAGPGSLPDLGGLGGFLAAFVPGRRADPYPVGMAKFLPAKSRLVFQVHYTPNGSEQLDTSKIGLVFADASKVKHEVRTVSAFNRRISIPAEADNHRIEATSRAIPDNALLLGFMPHMHLRGKAFRYEAQLPDGKTEVLLDVPRYDFNWQTAYRLADPKTLPSGTRLHCIAHYDNSEKNLNNPDPKKQVRWGDQTWNEMMIGFYDIAVPRTKTADAKPEKPDDKPAAGKVPEGGVQIPEAAMALIKRYDKNNDGKLDAKEIEDLPPRLRDLVMRYVERMNR